MTYWKEETCHTGKQNELLVVVDDKSLVQALDCDYFSRPWGEYERRAAHATRGVRHEL